MTALARYVDLFIRFELHPHSSCLSILVVPCGIEMVYGTFPEPFWPDDPEDVTVLVPKIYTNHRSLLAPGTS
jgi:hypothetical protein